MTKTLEQTLRDKIATGYDPVQLSVAVRAVNEANVEVSIEGVKYSVTGNDVSHIVSRKDTPAAETPEQAASNAAVPTAEEGNANSPQTEPATADAGVEGSGAAGAGDDTVKQPITQERLDAIKTGYAAFTIEHNGDAESSVWNVLNEQGGIIAAGSIEELEGFLAEQSQEKAAE